jgi:hypothetical protein
MAICAGTETIEVEAAEQARMRLPCSMDCRVSLGQARAPKRAKFQLLRLCAGQQIAGRTAGRAAPCRHAGSVASVNGRQHSSNSGSDSDLPSVMEISWSEYRPRCSAPRSVEISSAQSASLRASLRWVARSTCEWI